MLDQLNRETQALYRQVQTGVLRVQLPTPKWASDYAMAPIDRWGKKIDPEVRKKLAEQERLPPAPGTKATTQTAQSETAALAGQATYIIVRQDRGNAEPRRDPLLGGKLEMDVKADPSFSPNTIGLLLDEEGYVLVPSYIEREAVGDQPVRMVGSDGGAVAARFVGSDRQTGITLLRAEKPAGKPVTLGENRPTSGSLVLCLAPADGSGRLGLWADGAEDLGVIVDTDGKVAGIARFGQFLTGSACKLIARQLIEYGSVRRATLGVLITEIRQDDPLRRQQAMLGKRTAMRIDQVIQGSAADKAGLKPGDLLLALAGDAVTDIPSFAAAIAARSGSTELQVLRGDKVLTVQVDFQQQK
jgi:S1-C subfamily serine protease